MPETGLCVIESRWWAKGNHSVKPLFEVLSGIVENNPYSFFYEMFVEKNSLTKILQSVSNNTEKQYIYIASHGSSDGFGRHGGPYISRTELRNIISAYNSGSIIQSIYFGSCYIANSNNAKFLFKKSTNLSWIAGYQKAVDWVDSSAIDMMFWSKFLHEKRTNRSRRPHKKTEIDMMLHAASEMKNLMPNVFTALGFNIYYKDTGGTMVSVW